MRLHEYQSKSIFTKYGIPVPRGRIASTASEAKHVTEELGSRVVVKAQVLVGGRGKAGGIRLAKTPKEAEELAGSILGMELKGFPVRKVLVDEAVSIVKELYLSVSYDRQVKKPVLIASYSGGMDIEEVALQSPEKIVKEYIDPLIGLRDYQIRDLAVSMDLPHTHWRNFIAIAQGLWLAFWDNDATLAEINPMVITADQRLLALDGKMVVDDNALYRHLDIVEMRDPDIEPPAEALARKYELSYIKMDGNIGCMVNGAGLAMTTLDIIKLCGGEAADFLDIGGGASAEKVAAALRIILADENVHVVLVNIFGGITRCDVVARGILTSITDIKPHVPIIVRLVGTNAAEGLNILAKANIPTEDSLYEVAQKAVSLSKGGKE
jgi:succinyl-CoA synthetase beta subunit